MRIVLVSDSHLGSLSRVFEPNWRAVRQIAAETGADLTVHLGDISLDGASDPADLGYAYDLMRDWPTPIRFLPGNHDIGDNPRAPGMANAHPVDHDRLADYRARFGPDYWVMEADGWWVIALDAQLFGSETREEAGQWKWLGDRLRDARRRPVAVMLHKPLFQDGADDATPHVRYVPIAPRRRLLALFASVDVRLVVSGHTHQYLDRTFGRARHIWVPSSAFILPDSAQERIGEKLVGLGLLELTPEGHRFDLCRDARMKQHDLGDFPIVAQRMK
jgi:3',5'-cyclic AMP phosphodiesterase CpdA